VPRGTCAHRRVDTMGSSTGSVDAKCPRCCQPMDALDAPHMHRAACVPVLQWDGATVAGLRKRLYHCSLSSVYPSWRCLRHGVLSASSVVSLDVRI